MSFQISISGLTELSRLTLATDVHIDRRLYDHSRARIVLWWHDGDRYGDRQTAGLAAQALGRTIDAQWLGADLGASVNCFHGYIERATGNRTAGKSSLSLDCVTFSKRTDLAPRYRAFQSTTLLDICRQVIKSEPTFSIMTASDLSFDIPLSIQYDETDFAYVSRMLHAWGIPLSVSDTSASVQLGARGVSPGAPFPDADFRWSSVSFVGVSNYYETRSQGGSGPSSTVRNQVEQLHGQIPDVAAKYYALEDLQYTRPLHSQAHSLSDTAYYRLVFDGGVLPFTPGDVVKFEGQDTIVREVRITGDPHVASARQEFVLQAYALPYHPERARLHWPARALWAWVMENENDPRQSGRLQVKFDFEDLDPPSSSDRVWLPLLTPYGGGGPPSDGKSGSYSGFYSVPEVGERVLVEFLGEWDSEAVILGAVRHESVAPMFDPKDTKRWRLPSGTELAMTSKGSTEVLRLRCKDKIFFESKMDGANAEVTITPGESDGDLIHFKKGAGPPSLYILCDGSITVTAQQQLHLEGRQVQIKASGGNVNVDGSPNVMINCVPTPATPLSKQTFHEDFGSTSAKNRKLPGPINAES